MTLTFLGVCVCCFLVALLQCAGAAFCEIRSFLRSHIEIGVWREVFLGWGCGCGIGILRFRVLRRSCVFVTSLS